MSSVQPQSGDAGLANSAASAAAPRCHILQLPNELLFDILSAAAPWPEEVDGTSFCDLYAARRTLTLVSRQFNRVATPILYSQLTPTLRGIVAQNPHQDVVPYGMTAGGAEDMYYRRSMAVRLLHRTMAANHSLRALCRDLVFDMVDGRWDDDGDVFRQCGNDFVKWFTNTESLRFHDGLYAKVNKSTALSFLATASASMPRLKRLALTARRMEFPIERLFDPMLQTIIARFANLTELRLVGLSQIFRRGGRNYEPALESMFESETGRGQFTELTIQHYGAETSSLYVFLMWPARLAKFTCLGRCDFNIESGRSQLDLETVWSALLHHQLSLESIRIGSICDPVSYVERGEWMLGAVDFTLFQSLRFLSLSHWATGSGDRDSAAALHLAPGLETFEWTFEAEDGRPLFLNDFQQREEDFLRRLATTAAKQQVPLRKIAIVFTPLPGVGAWEDAEHASEYVSISVAVGYLDFEYPWDRMDRLATELRCLGIELTYNDPSVTRAVSDEVLRKAHAVEDVYDTDFGDVTIWNVIVTDTSTDGVKDTY